MSEQLSISAGFAILALASLALFQQVLVQPAEVQLQSPVAVQAGLIAAD